MQTYTMQLTSSSLVSSAWQHSLHSFSIFFKLKEDSSSHELHSSVAEEKPSSKQVSASNVDTSGTAKDNATSKNDNNGDRAIVVGIIK